jgi:hypothetical protein
VKTSNPTPLLNFLKSYKQDLVYTGYCQIEAWSIGFFEREKSFYELGKYQFVKKYIMT